MNKKKILIIDDEKKLCELMKDNLEHSGKFEVTTAYSGEEGLKKAGETDFDLVITDYTMPGMDGEAVLDALKETNPDLVVVLSSIYHDDNSTITTSIKSKADGLLTKPFNNEQLYKVIRDVCNRSRVHGSGFKGSNQKDPSGENR